MRMLLLTSMCWLLAVGTAVRAETILGNFDPTEEVGWGYWSGGLQTPISGGDEMEVSTEAATTGTSSVKMGHDGWQQALAYSAGTAGTIADFAANDTIEFDVIFKTDTAPNGGYQKIESVTFNYDAGWTTLSGSELFHGWGASTDPQEATYAMSVDYSSLGLSPSSTINYMEVIFTINNGVDDTTNEAVYIDHVRLTTSIPEPTSALLACLAAIGLSFRRNK